MTCIVGYVDNDTVYIGADSAGVSGSDIRIRADEKVFKNGEFLFGFTSSFRMGQILRYNFNPPKRNENISDDEYLYNDFIDGVISVLKEKNYAEIDNNVIRGGVFLFGYRGKLYQIEGDFQIGKPSKKYDAVGCGEDYALGCLYGLESNQKLSVTDKITEALKSAEYFSAGVSSPFCIKELKKGVNK